MIEKRYPQGKRKAFNVTYDDGVLQDVRFVQLLNQYGLKGTFNLNSELMQDEFVWTHASGLDIKRLSPIEAAAVYVGHEVASHTLNHPQMEHLPEHEVMRQLREDKENLGLLYDEEIRGFAVPFDYYSDMIEECVKNCGFAYCRISEESHSFAPQNDFYHWKATVFHTDPKLAKLTEQFLSAKEELACFQIVGHTYDLDVENMWEKMEKIFKKISADEDVLPMTTIEMVDYLRSMEYVDITNTYIKNNSLKPLWFAVDGELLEVQPGEAAVIGSEEEPVEAETVIVEEKSTETEAVVAEETAAEEPVETEATAAEVVEEIKAEQEIVKEEICEAPVAESVVEKPAKKEKKPVKEKKSAKAEKDAVQKFADEVEEEDTGKAYAYMLECRDGSLYTGWTNDLDKRLAAHNAGTGAKYTRTRTPVKLVYFEEFATKQEAMQREAQIKKMKRPQKLKLMESREEK